MLEIETSCGFLSLPAATKIETSCGFLSLPAATKIETSDRLLPPIKYCKTYRFKAADGRRVKLRVRGLTRDQQFLKAERVGELFFARCLIPITREALRKAKQKEQ